MSGAEIIVGILAAHGVERLHVYPGGTIAPVVDRAVASGMGIYCARHEQGAGYAALAAARRRGTPQVVMVTSGPGVTNLVTAVADGYYDSTPLIVITGQVGTADLQRSRELRQRGFQEADALSILGSVTKAGFQPKNGADLVNDLAEAFRIAVDGRPGPVVIDVPMDVQRSEQPVAPLPGQAKREPAPQVSGRQIGEVVEWLSRAQRPLVIAGQGVLLAQAQTQLRELLRLAPMPVSHSLLGLGAVPGDFILNLGFHGHTGTQAAGCAIQECDFLLVLGSRLDLRQTGTETAQFAPDARIVRVEADDSEIAHARVRIDRTLRGDVGAVLDALNAGIGRVALPDWSAWHARIEALKAEHALQYGPGLKPQAIIEEAAKLTRGLEVDVVSGVGSHQQWVARHFDFDHPRRRWLTSGGHGAMGFDLPVAAGAQLDDPGRMVLCFVGDGSVQMNIQELAALVEYDLPVKIVVLDNRRLGIVSQFQLLNWAADPTCGRKRNPDFAAIARGYGMTGLTLNRVEDMQPRLRELIATPGPALLHCLVDEAEDVSPMLLPGQTLDRMWRNG